MKITYRIITGILMSSLLLGGCSLLMNSEETQNPNPENDQSEVINENSDYISVQDYTGQGYELPNGEETDKIAEEHAEEIEKAVVRFFKEEYKTDVEVHNMVGAVDGVSVFVESKGKPHFYSFAIVPIDKQNEVVLTDQVWSQEGQVEIAIMSSLYAWINEDKFNKLDHYLKEFVQENPVVGKREEANQNVGGGYYMTPYYFISLYREEPFKELLNAYFSNPNQNVVFYKKEIKESELDYNKIFITINLFMEEKHADPNEEIFNRMVRDIESMEGLALGNYAVYLHDNSINVKDNSNLKSNVLEKSDPDPILKK